ncbi:3'-5' exonuclease domain-containing protein [Tasmannia lanceolata]|uniref:3'-5' exonuclease domain-containing protein n=1 Tax=Tasmannia lanceolata TaxID=3420 RepID=UPI004062FFBD
MNTTTLMDSNSRQTEKPFKNHFISSIESHEFSIFLWALDHSSIIGLDAEWKPSRTPNPTTFPHVSILQIACRIRGSESEDDGSINDSWVFLLDLLSIPLTSIWELLRDMFVSPYILKLGFKFKQDSMYLSSTFCSQGCEPGFDKVEPYLDITSIYHHLQDGHPGKKLPKDTKSLAAICEEVLGVYLSKELQCSDWSCRPLTEEQKSYAAADACCLLEIFNVFQCKLLIEGISLYDTTELSNVALGLKEILKESDICNAVLTKKIGEGSDVVKSTVYETHPGNHNVLTSFSWPSHKHNIPMDDSLSKIVQKYGEKILLEDSDRKPRASRRKERKHSSVNSNSIQCSENYSGWQGPPPWDSAFGGDGCPKFLCDVMVEGLAKHLRCVGIDAATPSFKKPETRQLLNQAHKEKRVLLTRDTKLMKHQYLIRNQVYRVKNLLKNDQLLEVIETFQLKISEDQLMTRCTKCNGKFIQKPLTTDEAVAAAKGFQVIPSCLFDRNLEFWQCTDCNQLYWEGTQYHNAVQKFVDICKLND